MLLIADSHVHLDDRRFDDDREDVLARARHAGVEQLIVPATDRGSWTSIDRLADQWPHVHGAYGLHPMFLDRHREEDLAALPVWLERHGAVAVGEIGLDYFVEGLDRTRQQHVFETQLAVARDHDLPVILHARRAQDQVTHTLRKFKGLRGVVHSFAGSEQQADQLIDLGFHLGIGGPVTYPRAKRLQRIVSTLPIEHLLLETDAPDQPGTEHRGCRNEPAWIVSVLQQVARLRGESEARIAEATTENVRRLFRLP